MYGPPHYQGISRPIAPAYHQAFTWVFSWGALQIHPLSLVFTQRGRSLLALVNTSTNENLIAREPLLDHLFHCRVDWILVGGFPALIGSEIGKVAVPPKLKIHIYMGVSNNYGTPKSSILIGFSIINHPFWEYPYFWKHPYIRL